MGDTEPAISISYQTMFSISGVLSVFIKICQNLSNFV